ncbi:S-layer homology domain-containing protein [Paenibacillus sp. LHD-117]|uniref:S-layer homology domain-containing protein n=1 Tax=Paenibacillus sp. LHD-117 TaxID=3071412 RepID=UPI0027DFB871|nr:S-layer homology domain-containing protein [Paenibacillus sp. LHD-117]MDQ6419687.1 S-layer homology domain-containing protein [Paenibacillus sp. LHD-117]
MKKSILVMLVCAMLLLDLLGLSYGSKVEAVETVEATNVALQATASTTGVTGQNDISNIIDGSDGFGWTTGNHALPQDVVLDWGDKKVKTNKLTLLTNYGPGQGITKLDVEYFDGTDWKTARADVTIDWKKNEQLAEAIDIAIPEIETTKIRLHVEEANLAWDGFAIIELKVWGELAWTADMVAQSITAIDQPDRGQTRLTLPAVRSGFDVRILSSDREDRIALDGTITQSKNAATVTLVFEVTNKADQSKAVTSPIKVELPGVPPADYATFAPLEDKTSIIKNPAMGWVLYVEEFPQPLIDAEEYWSAVDPYIEPASILYIRVPWSRMEPEEGHYAWNEDENFKKLVDMALERNLKLAFRVIVDSQDVHMQATPQFVFDAGAQGYETSSNASFRTPKLTDPVFREKFERFVAAFARQYDDPSRVDFIDAQGLGWWGEMHNIKGLNKEEMNDTFKWITNLYSSEFKSVLLGGQYGNVFDDELEEWAINEKGYMIRRDSYGSPVWFPQGDKDSINAHWPDVPVFAENCYQSFVYRPTACDSMARPIHDMLTRVVNDAVYTHANTLDLRHPEDVEEWVTNHPELVQRFALEGGYRLVLNDVAYPSSMTAGQSYPIYHSWSNAAVGKLPNDMLNWEHKYKVAMALLDRETHAPVHIEIDDTAEPSDWIAGDNYYYTGMLDLKNVPAGDYELAMAIVDSTNRNEPAIQLAVTGIQMDSGWYKLSDVRIAPADRTPETPPTPPTTTPEKPPTSTETMISGNTVTVTAVQDDKGNASITVSEADLQEAAGTGGKTVVVTVKHLTASSPNSVTMKLPVGQLRKMGDQSQSLVLNAGLATVTLSAEQITREIGQDGKQLQMSVSKADISNLSEDERDQIGSRPVFDFTLSVDDVIVSQFKQKGDVTVGIPYKLKAGENPSQMIIYFISSKGELELVKNGKYDKATESMIFSPSHFSRYAVAHRKVIFTDITSLAWAKDSIEALASRDIIKGVKEGLFNPQGEVTRAEFLTMLVNALGIATDSGKPQSTFSDVMVGQWYTNAIYSAQRLGIVNGRGDGTFGVNDKITRQDMVVILYRALKLSKPAIVASSFKDKSSIRTYAQEPVQAVFEAGFIKGLPNGNFNPLEGTTRAEAAVVIHRIIQ